MHKKILIISRKGPYGNSLAREAIDAALAAAVYDQNINILFMDDGVFQLVKHQNPAQINQKSLIATLSSMELYGIDRVYVHKQSLDERGLSIDSLGLDNIDMLNNIDVKKIIDEQDHLLSF